MSYEIEETFEDSFPPEDETEDLVVESDDRPVASQTADWTISALRDKFERGQIDVQPEYQREYVWALRPELPSRLIESLLLEIPIPPIYLAKCPINILKLLTGNSA